MHHLFLTPIIFVQFIIMNEEKDIDICCSYPYDCAYYGYCGRHLPTPSIFDVRRLSAAKKYGYYHQGIVSYQDIIEKQAPLSAKQLKQVEAEYYAKPDEIRPGAIKNFLKKGLVVVATSRTAIL